MSTEISSATRMAGAAAEAWRERRGRGSATETDLDCALARFIDAAERELRTAETHRVGHFPHVTENGRWQLLDVDNRSTADGEHYEHGNWTAGFRVGVAWLHTIATGRAESRRAAEAWLESIASRAGDHTTHDVGFLFFPSVALPHLAGLTLDAGELELGLRAASCLARRWNPHTGLLQAFGPIGADGLAGTSTIDTMVNLPLLWWAARHGGDLLLYDIARRHARTSARLYVRPDASTFQLLSLDPISGAVIHRGTFQGADDGSCWSRGQAWAACGLSWAYAACGEDELLEAAERTTDYFFEQLPSTGLPPWDFFAADPVPDASAGAIVGLGCLLLGEFHPDPGAARRYAEAGRDLLWDLSSSCLNDGPDDGILVHSTYSLPHGRGVDGATGFGDFFFGLALACAQDLVPTSALAAWGRSSRTGSPRSTDRARGPR